MPAIGTLNRRITIQRKPPAVGNVFNEDVDDVWTTLATVWARRRDASDASKLEYLAAGQVGSFHVARFTIRSTPLTRTLAPVDRLIEGGHLWEVQGVKELDEGRHRFLEITAARETNHG